MKNIVATLLAVLLILHCSNLSSQKSSKEYDLAENISITHSANDIGPKPENESPWGYIDPKLASVINEFYNPEGEEKELYENNTRENYLAQIKRAEGTLKKLSKINYEKLDLANRVDYDYFQAQLDNQLQNIREIRVWEKKPSMYIPFDNYFAASLDKTTSEKERYESMIQAIEGSLGSFENGKNNLTDPALVWVDKSITYASDVEGYLNNRMPGIIEGAPTDALRERMQKAADEYTAKLLDFKEFLSEDLRPRASGQAPLGRKEYERALKNFFVNYSVEELIKIGSELHKRTVSQMEETAKEIDPEKSWQELIQENRLNHVAPWELFPKLEREAKRAQKIVYERLVNVPADVKEFYHYTDDGHPTTYPVGASGIGPFVFMEGDQYHGYYALPTIDDYETLERKAAFMRDWNDSWYIVQQIPHEVYPGHHFQNFMLSKNHRPARMLNGSLPFTEISATMTEGWCVYSEEVMYNMGYLQNDKRLYLSHLQHRLWRIVRIIAEPSYHTGIMSFEEVKKMFIESGTTQGQAWVEATQLVEMPGHDVTYYIGVIMLKQLMQDYKNIVGEENFDLKDFNTKLLERGYIAMPLAAEEMLEIAREQVRNRD
jgi:uncharacterized protein (DUF885 family)